MNIIAFAIPGLIAAIALSFVPVTLDHYQSDLSKARAGMKVETKN
ncbi:hypothetical protein [Peribacillus muralis]